MQLTEEQRFRLDSLKRAVQKSKMAMLQAEGEFIRARNSFRTFEKLLAEEEELLGMGQQELPLENGLSTS